MKVSKKWLEQYAAIPVGLAEYQHEMVMRGTAVEGIEDWAAQVQNVVVGRILSVVPHENSDHLLVCQVDVGDRTLQIVTGAPNVSAGDLVPVAVDGAGLPGGKRIRAGKLRGVESQGMLCSGPELGVPADLYPSPGEEGILLFAEEYPLGADVRPILGIDDQVIDFEILANRPDCQCVWGVARETAVAMGTAFRKPQITVDTVPGATVPGAVQDFVRIRVEDDALCPRYVGRVVTDVRIAPSPLWMRAALHAAGVRSINNVVDITNYVMLETGHPMHAFDLDKVRERAIVVRRARAGETLRTLDGKDRALTPDMLVIADNGAATGVAGVMGGEESEITEGTRTLLFECAAFDRTSVRVTSRALGLRTESSARFEKGVCPATAREAIDRACQLVRLLDAGNVVEGVYDHYPNPVERPEITASVRRIARRAGIEIPGEQMARILRALGFNVALRGDELRARAPAFRQDVDGEADLCEEVLRIYGYEHLQPTTLRGESTGGGKSSRIRARDRVKRLLTAMGYYEAISFSFVSPKAIDKLRLAEDDPRRAQLKLLNPLGEDTGAMRASMAPSMLGMLALNFSRGNEQAALFEVAPVFDIGARKSGELPGENWTLCVGGYGPGLDFYQLRDMLTELLRQFGVPCRVAVGGEPYHHPGRAATLMAGGQPIAALGEVHPEVCDAFELPRRPLIAELDLERLMALERPVDKVAPLPRFPAVTRDLALAMDERVPVGEVAQAIAEAGAPLLEQVQVFDVYRGAQVGEGKKSVAFSLVFRHAERTLEDADIAPVFDGIVRACEQRFGAAIRS
ncbi:MAG: phenylalanine--tRNA ligase subunit beta [Clostridia bacterium]|nr:phenylalanine--tRNA ligase subunit beta [Clostridia bacterium]